MKYLVVLSLCVTFAYALDQSFIEKFMARVQKSGTACKESSKVSDEEISNLMGKNPPKTKEGKCLMFCMNQEFGIQDANGKLTKDAAMKELQKVKDNNDMDTYNKALTVLNHCMGSITEHSDPCETAALYSTCALAKSKDVNLTEAVLGL